MTPTRADNDGGDPLLERIMANRLTLLLGAVAAAVFGCVGLLLTGLVGAGGRSSPWVGWPMLAFGAAVLIATVRQLLWPVPVVEVTSRGVRLRIRTPMSRSGFLFVPWSHLRAVIVTQVATPHGGRQDALGFQIAQDEAIRLPDLRWNAGQPAPEAPQCDVTFAAATISGDVRDWVRKIEQCRLRAG